ncbi:RNA ligase [Mycena vulgaris]|nr:RNA ligase [Mycena vulgaris]
MAHTAIYDDSMLIAELHIMKEAKGHLLHASDYPAPADPSLVLRSWKMTEHQYYVMPSPLPTLARGLFTLEEPRGKGQGGIPRIVVRGYDKFFNVGEVVWTTWAALEKYTEGPYTLSLKSNGCIIFIAALTPWKLLITSKHSLGPASADRKRSHADAGEAWLRRYLEQKGRTEAELAAVLWEKNLTAVAELCDDSFEEHVLAYPPELTGLHLHGLNESTTAFKTLPQAEVDAFAAEWGFIPTESTELPTLADVRAFTDDVGRTGAWNGVPVEGFVVRTRVAPPLPNATPRAAPPYPPGATLFFKVKFDEPYMMYRDWREVTKALLNMRSRTGASGDAMKVQKLPKTKMRRPETKAYAHWVIEEIRRHPVAFAEYSDNKGIIAVRERFLAYLATDEGKKALGQRAENEPMEVPKKFEKTVIVPIGIPGSGKTSIAVALAHIFGFKHTQSDDVLAKKASAVFLKNVTDLLETHDVVIADRNNHLKTHRAAFRDISPRPRLLALNWALNAPRAVVHRICADRVKRRGAAHLTLRADASNSHEAVVSRFLHAANPLILWEVDAVVMMELSESLEAAVARAVAGCVRVLGLPEPTPRLVAAGVERARAYTPLVKTRADPPGGALPPVPRYFALVPELELGPLLEPVLTGVPFWEELKAAGRVTARPHVTLVHMNELQEKGVAVPEARDLWARCAALHEATRFRVRLGHVVWSARVMAVTVDAVEAVDMKKARGAGVGFVRALPPEAWERLHITIGTREAPIPPVEAKGLVQSWRRGLAEAYALPIPGQVVIEASFKGLQA